jgi:hypothetical protein
MVQMGRNVIYQVTSVMCVPHLTEISVEGS